MSQDLEISAERELGDCDQNLCTTPLKEGGVWGPRSSVLKAHCSPIQISALYSTAEVSVSQFVSSNFHFVSLKESQAKCWKKTWFNCSYDIIYRCQESRSKELCIPLPKEGQPQTEAWRHTKSSSQPYLQSPHWKRCGVFLNISAHAAKILKGQTGTHSSNTQFQLLSSHGSTGDNK